MNPTAPASQRSSREAEQNAHREALQIFWDSCKNNDTERIKHVWETGQANLTDALNYMRNAEEVQREVAILLLEYGVDPNEVIPIRGDGYYSRDLLDVLISYGWDFQSKGPQLLIHKFDDREWVEWIVNKGIDLNKPTNHNNRIRRLGPTRGFGHASDPSGIGERDYTVGCLSRAAAKGDIGLFDYFVEHGADPKRSIALHRVAQCKDPKMTTAMIVHLIEKYEMDPMASDKCNGLRWRADLGGSWAISESGTPMDFAMSYGNVAAVEAFLWYGVDPVGVVEWAVRGGFLNFLRMILQEGRESNGAVKGAVEAVEYGRLDALKICMEFGAKVEDWKNAVPDRYKEDSDEEYEPEEEQQESEEDSE